MCCLYLLKPAPDALVPQLARKPAAHFLALFHNLANFYQKMADSQQNAVASVQPAQMTPANEALPAPQPPLPAAVASQPQPKAHPQATSNTAAQPSLAPLAEPLVSASQPPAALPASASLAAAVALEPNSRHLLAPALHSSAAKAKQTSSSCEPARYYADGEPVRVPLENLELDRPDLSLYLDRTTIHLDTLGKEEFCTLHSSQPPPRIAPAELAKDPNAVALWSAAVGGVELVMTLNGLQTEEDKALLAKLAPRLKVHILPQKKIVQKAKSPACAWANRS